jgi:uncharacterized cupredoxin-like copper-binding protein
MKRRTFLSAAVAAGLPVAAGAHGDPGETAFGRPGDPAKPARLVELLMGEADGRMLYRPDRLAVRPGEQVRFRLRNAGALEHEFVIGTIEDNRRHMKAMEMHPDMQHDDPNGRRLKPGATGEILWQFTRAGTFEFACLIPGHHQAGMVGTIEVA